MPHELRQALFQLQIETLARLVLVGTDVEVEATQGLDVVGLEKRGRWNGDSLATGAHHRPAVGTAFGDEEGLIGLEPAKDGQVVDVTLRAPRELEPRHTLRLGTLLASPALAVGTQVATLHRLQPSVGIIIGYEERGCIIERTPKTGAGGRLRNTRHVAPLYDLPLQLALFEEEMLSLWRKYGMGYVEGKILRIDHDGTGFGGWVHGGGGGQRLGCIRQFIELGEAPATTIGKLSGIITDIHPEGICQPKASLFKLQVLTMHHQVDGSAMSPTNVAMIRIVSLRKVEARMGVAVEGA